MSEYKHVLAHVLRSRYVARTPPVEARSPGRRSNVENAPSRRPVTGQPATPTSHIRRAILRTPPVTRQSPASSARRLRRVFALRPLRSAYDGTQRPPESRNTNRFLWPPCVADTDIIFCPVISSSFFFFPSPNLSGRRIDVYTTLPHMVWP